MNERAERIDEMRKSYGIDTEVAAMIDSKSSTLERYANWLERELAHADMRFEAVAREQPAASPLVTIGGVSFVLIEGTFFNIAHIEHVEISNETFYVWSGGESYHIFKDNSQYPALCALFGFTPTTAE